MGSEVATIDELGFMFPRLIGYVLLVAMSFVVPWWMRKRYG